MLQAKTVLKELQTTLNYKPSIRELANYLEVPEETIQRLLAYDGPQLSLNKSLKSIEEQEVELIEVVV